MMTQQDYLNLVKTKMAHREKTVKMFEKCFADTLDNTVCLHGDGTAFMLTGDIPAMWLRDSTNQLRPYLLMAKDDARVRRILLGVMKKQVLCILSDPYANAFNDTPNGAGHQTDKTEMKPFLWERKYEIDSLCYPVQLAYLYYRNTGDTTPFDSDFLRAAERILDVWTCEQNHACSPYSFERTDCPETDTLPCGGKGNPVAVTGMTWSGFRPSDDRCVYGYLIPSELFASTVLSYLQTVFTEIYHREDLAKRAQTLKNDIDLGVAKYGILRDDTFGEVYAYETDGLGHYTRMDDANVPSLLSLPYLGCCEKTDPLYRATRAWCLSENNPYYFKGSKASGIGSPHTPQDYIWPIALAIQGLTSTDEAEREHLLDLLEQTDADTLVMHEGFHKDDPTRFTRPWFSWANAVFAEFVLSLCGVEIRLS